MYFIEAKKNNTTQFVVYFLFQLWISVRKIQIERLQQEV